MTLAAVTPLSTSLREETAGAHTQAEQAAFLAALLEGALSVEAFADYTAQLHVIYVELERVIRAAAGHPMLDPFYDPRLERSAALENDLRHLYGPEWRDVVRILPATRAYVSRLASLRADGVGELAHHYVRYLGDLSGGQVIARLAQIRYGLEPRHLSFYDFSCVGKIKPYRDSYRHSLDELELSARGREVLVAEAHVAFRLNFSVLAALGARHGLA